MALLLLALLLALTSAASSFQVVQFSPTSGVISVRYDVIKFNPDGYILNINGYSGDPQCRKLLGWEVSWTFPRNELIWAISGAYLQDKGNCSAVFPAGGGSPFGCIKTPSVMDNREPSSAGKLALARGGPNCHANACAPFVQTVKVIVGNGGSTVATFRRPSNFQVVGFKCSEPISVTPEISGCSIKSLLSWRVDCAPKPDVAVAP